MNPAFPPTCGDCGRALERANTVAVAFDPCYLHPRARVVYHLQAPRDGYPAGWPICAHATCGKPTVDGKMTCGDAACAPTLGRRIVVGGYT